MGKKRKRNRGISRAQAKSLQQKFPIGIRIHPTDEVLFGQEMNDTLQGIHFMIATFQEKENTDQAGELNELIQLIGDLCVGLWRINKRIAYLRNNDLDKDIQILNRPVQNTVDRALQAGIEIKDYSNTPYIDGMIERVVAFEPTKGILRETILETIKPSIYYKENLIHHGEIIVGTPE